MVEQLRLHGSWTSRTHLQKALYFCVTMLHERLGLNFVMSHHGPFSPALDDAIEGLIGHDLLTEIPQRGLGPKLELGPGANIVLDVHGEALAELRQGMAFLAQRLGRRPVTELERLSTALHCQVEDRSAGGKDVASQVVALKPHIDINDAFAAFLDVRRIGAQAHERGLIRPWRDDRSLLPGPIAGTADQAPRSLIVDSASAGRRLGNLEFGAWARNRTVFLSSEMRELGDLREHVARRLRDTGFRVVFFEGLGGRNEDARRAYLDGVARADIYVGFVARRYGTMQPTRLSPTHEEYRRARELGKTIMVWADADDAGRQRDAADFLQEVETFHTTGRYRDAEDLGDRLLDRLAEIAATEDMQWIKLGDICVRAHRIRDTGSTIEVIAQVRDRAVARALVGLRHDPAGRPAEVPIALAHQAGTARVTSVITETESAAIWTITLIADVVWADGSAADGLDADELVHAELRHGLLEARSAAPDRVSPAKVDPLAPMASAVLPAAAEEPVAALLIAEHLLGGGRASEIECFRLGPSHLGERRIELRYLTPRRDGSAPNPRAIEGLRHDG